jgi:hypothetical protein
MIAAKTTLISRREATSSDYLRPRTKTLAIEIALGAGTSLSAITKYWLGE